jgi:hypothetical protein
VLLNAKKQTKRATTFAPEPRKAAAMPKQTATRQPASEQKMLLDHPLRDGLQTFTPCSESKPAKRTIKKQMLPENTPRDTELDRDAQNMPSCG